MPDSTLIARRLTTLRTHYVVKSRFSERHPNILVPEDLKALPLIHGSVDHWIMKNHKEQRIINVGQGIKAATGRTMRHAALSGLGVTRLTDVYCHADLASGRLIEVLRNGQKNLTFARLSASQISTTKSQNAYGLDKRPIRRTL